jgi:pilus assembly protein CpaE
MYPLRVVMVGCSEGVVTGLRRELANLQAKVECELPTFREAMLHVTQSGSEVRLFIVQLKNADELKALERLNEAFLGQPILTLVDLEREPTLLVRAMRAGAAQIVRLPLQPEDFQAAMSRIALQFGHPTSVSRVIAVCGTSSGCGATSLAINLSGAISRAQTGPCILAETSVAMGRLASYLGLQPRFTLYDLLSDLEHLDLDVVRQALTPVDDKLSVLASSYRAATPVDVTTDQMLRVVHYLRQLSESLVLDLSTPSCDGLTFDIMANAHHVVFIGEQRIPSLHAMKLIQNKLMEQESMARQYMVINHFNPSLTEFSYERLCEVIGTSCLWTIDHDYNAFRKAEDNGKLLFHSHPGCGAVSDIDSLAAAILGKEGSKPRPPHRTMRSLLGRLRDSLTLR